MNEWASTKSSANTNRPPGRLGKYASTGKLKLLAHYIPPEELPENGGYHRVKFALDWSLAALLAVFALPLVVIAAVAVRLTSRGPAFYTQVRVGRHGRPYRLFKIRSMCNNAEQLTGPRWSGPDDKRITRVGHFLRSTHLDELPQLLNVLRGEMSLVGPRPERPEIVPSLEVQIPGYSQRLAVRPGVTGLAQLQLPADTDIASVRRKLSYDLYYVRRHNISLDLRLILCTAFKMVGMSYGTQRRLFVLPHPEEVVKVSRLPLEEFA